MKNFARIIELQERQVLFYKEDSSDADAEDPYSIVVVFDLADGIARSQQRWSYKTLSARETAFTKISTKLAREIVDGLKGMEKGLREADDN